MLRRDLFGTRVTRRATPATPAPAGLAAVRQPRAAGRRGARATARCRRTLVVTQGSLQGTTINLGQAPILIGRAPECTLVLEDDFASGRHARLSLQQGTWMVEDLGSTNGTFLGRNRVQAPTPVSTGRSGQDRAHRPRAAEVVMAIALRYAARSDVGLVRYEQPGLRLRRPPPARRRRRYGRARGR